MATQADIVDLITVLRAALPKQSISSKQFDEMVPVWTMILEDIPAELLGIAAKEWCSKDDPFFPSVGQIRTGALDLIATDADRITAADAWDEICRAFRSVGHTRSPEWSHPDIGRAVQGVGGWRYLCTSDNPMADRARFMDTFKVYRRRAETDRRMLPATREFVAQHRQIEAGGPAGLIEAEVKRLAEGMATEMPQLEAR